MVRVNPGGEFFAGSVGWGAGGAGPCASINQRAQIGSPHSRGPPAPEGSRKRWWQVLYGGAWAPTAQSSSGGGGGSRAHWGSSGAEVAGGDVSMDPALVVRGFPKQSPTGGDGPLELEKRRAQGALTRDQASELDSCRTRTAAPAAGDFSRPSSALPNCCARNYQASARARAGFWLVVPERGGRRGRRKRMDEQGEALSRHPELIDGRRQRALQPGGAVAKSGTTGPILLRSSSPLQRGRRADRVAPDAAILGEVPAVSDTDAQPAVPRRVELSEPPLREVTWDDVPRPAAGARRDRWISRSAAGARGVSDRERLPIDAASSRSKDARASSPG